MVGKMMQSSSSSTQDSSPAAVRRKATLNVTFSPPTVVVSDASSSSSSSFTARSVWNSVLAGYAAGISGTLVGHPFDSAKVWMQTQTASPLLSSSTMTQPQPPSAAAATASMSCCTSAATTSTTTTTTVPVASGSTATSTPSSSQQSLQLRSVHNTTVRAASSATASVVVAAPPPSAPTTTAAATTTLSSRSLLRQAAHHERFLQNIRALYAGVTGPLLTVGLVQSINFAVYDAMRRFLYTYNQQQQQHVGNDNHHANCYRRDLSLPNVALASASAGAVLAVLTSPMLLTKTQQQTVPGLGFRQAVRQTLQKGCWSVAFGPHFVSETAGRAVYFGTYEALQRYMVSCRCRASSSSSGTNQEPATTATLSERMVSAAAAGIVCWSVIFPLDAIRCRLYAQTAKAVAAETAASSSSSTTASITAAAAAAASTNCNNSDHHAAARRLLQTRAMVQHMYQTGGGIAAFYRGFGVTVLRAGPVAAAVLPVYDWALDQLSSSSSS